MKFESVPAQATSDHKPVRAQLHLQLLDPLPIPRGPLAVHEGKAQWPVLRVASLAARDLTPMDAYNGKADPYLEFTTLPTRSMMVKTTTIPRTLNPEWKQTLDIELFVSNVADLKRLNLEVICHDKDVVGHELIGGIIISMAPFTDKKYVVVDERLARHGQSNRGTVRFVLTLLWPHPKTGELRPLKL